MNRKQGIIIVVLLALIATAGVLASRLNSPLLVGEASNEQNSVLSFKEEDSNLKTEYFAQAKTERSKAYADTMQILKSVMQDTSVSMETRQEAENKYLDITMNNNYESKVELALKAKGYEDVVCIIQNDKVNITIKSNDFLDEKEAREIKNEVVRITNLVDIVIDVKK